MNVLTLTYGWDNGKFVQIVRNADGKILHRISMTEAQLVDMMKGAPALKGTSETMVVSHLQLE